MGLYKIKKLLHNKRNGHHNEEADVRKSVSAVPDKELITRRYRELKN
jgi:hypothetical protein